MSHPLIGCLTSAFQPRRLRIGPAAVGCKRLLGRTYSREPLDDSKAHDNANCFVDRTLERYPACTGWSVFQISDAQSHVPSDCLLNVAAHFPFIVVRDPGVGSTVISKVPRVDAKSAVPPHVATVR
jgi:hypothetical protein